MCLIKHILTNIFYARASGVRWPPMNLLTLDSLSEFDNHIDASERGQPVLGQWAFYDSGELTGVPCTQRHVSNTDGLQCVLVNKFRISTLPHPILQLGYGLKCCVYICCDLIGSTACPSNRSLRPSFRYCVRTLVMMIIALPKGAIVITVHHHHRYISDFRSVSQMNMPL